MESRVSFVNTYPLDRDLAADGTIHPLNNPVHRLRVLIIAGTMRWNSWKLGPNCLSQEHNTMTPASARTLTAYWPGVQRVSHCNWQTTYMYMYMYQYNRSISLLSVIIWVRVAWNTTWVEVIPWFHLFCSDCWIIYCQSPCTMHGPIPGYPHPDNQN